MLMGIIGVAVRHRIIKMWALEGNLLPIPFRLLFPPPSSAPPLLPHHCPLSLSISYPNLLSYNNLPPYKTITRRFRIRIIKLHLIISHHASLKRNRLIFHKTYPTPGRAFLFRRGRRRLVYALSILTLNLSKSYVRYTCYLFSDGIPVSKLYYGRYWNWNFDGTVNTAGMFL
jgi:hypothetical protein